MVCAGPAKAELNSELNSRIIELEAEVKSLNDKLDLILQKLDNENKEVNTVSEKAVKKMKSGALLQAYLVSKRMYKNIKSGEVIDSTIDVSGVWEPRNIFTKNSQYAEIYAKKRIGGYWTGFFNALESGRYVFSYKAKGQGSNKSGCWISFYMNDQPVFEGAYGVHGADFVKHIVLKKGPNRVVLWFALSKNKSGLAPTILYKEPSGSNFHAFTPSSLYHPE
jgi:hypothetical protein